MQLVRPEEIIVTNRLHLEPILPEHASKLFNYLQNDDLYFFIPQEPPASEQDLFRRYTRWANRQSNDGSELWLNYAMYRPSNEDYVGTLQATIMSIDSAYIAYETFSNVRRQHFAQEGCNALLHHLFKNYSLNQVIAHVDIRNTASWKLLESLDFVRIETIKNADYFKGEQSDEYVYKKILKD